MALCSFARVLMCVFVCFLIYLFGSLCTKLSSNTHVSVCMYACIFISRRLQPVTGLAAWRTSAREPRAGQGQGPKALGRLSLTKRLGIPVVCRRKRKEASLSEGAVAKWAPGGKRIASMMFMFVLICICANLRVIWSQVVLFVVDFLTCTDAKGSQL